MPSLHLSPDINMRNLFNRNKTKFTIAAMAAGLGLHLGTHAQVAKDSGTLIIHWQHRYGGLGNEVGTVGQGSRALVRAQTHKDRLKVVWGDKPDETCKLDNALDEKQTANASGFINLKLTCEVADVAEKTRKI